MLQPKCEICGQPAVIHETAVAGEGAVTRHLCREHGQPAVPVLDFGPQAAQAAEEQYRSLSDAEKEHFALLELANGRAGQFRAVSLPCGFNM
jgi:hypothetical protein